MRLKYAIVADSAQVGPDGKFTLIGGGIDAMNASGFPALTAGLSLLVRLLVDESELDREHRFAVELLSPSGENLVPDSPASLVFTPRRNRPDIDVPVAHVIVANFPGLVFPMAGRYVFRLLVDDDTIDEVALQALIAPPTTQA